MPNKRIKPLAGPSTPARRSETSSVHSISDSNDYILCLENYFKMPRDHSLPKAQWDENMELHFCMTFVEWKKSGEWSPNISTEANWMKLAAHLNKEWGKQYAWSVYHSKFSRMKKIWRLYVKLKGLRHSAETGIGWDENKRCFLADCSQWNNLQLENQDYKHFRHSQCVDKYAILSEVLDGETATGDQAHCSSVPPAQVFRQSRGVYSSGQMSQQYGDDDDNCWLDDVPNQGPKWAGKRPASSQGGTSSFQGSRGSKSSRNSDNPFVECAASLTNLASAKLQKYEGRSNVDSDKYDVTMAAKVVESFEDVPMAKQVVALQKLQDDKWRQTFLSVNRNLQAFYLHSLEIGPSNEFGSSEKQGGQ